MKKRQSWQARTVRLVLACMELSVLMGLTGCGDGQGAKAPAPAEPTAEQKVAQLEASGMLPKLDRLPTLEGVDANGDGVRDDIALHIEKKYADLAQRKAAMQEARSFQKMLLVNKNDSVALEDVSTVSFKAVKCSSDVFTAQGIRSEYHKMSEEIKAMTTNTKERLQAYLAFNKAVSGMVSSMPAGDTCE